MTPIAAIAQSGLAAASLRLNASAANLANAGDTSAIGVSGYQPIAVDDSTTPDGGVAARAVTLNSPPVVAYDPTSPVANVRGYVDAPEIDPISEVSNALAAGRAFAFSAKVLNAADKDEQTLLDLKT